MFKDPKFFTLNPLVIHSSGGGGRHVATDTLEQTDESTAANQRQEAPLTATHNQLTFKQ